MPPRWINGSSWINVPKKWEASSLAVYTNMNQWNVSQFGSCSIIMCRCNDLVIVPTKQQVMVLLLSYEYEDRKHDTARACRLDSEAQFLFNSIDIKRVQWAYNVIVFSAPILTHVCRHLIKDDLHIHEEHSSDQSLDEIEKRQDKVSVCLKAHQCVQKQLMPAVYTHYIDKELNNTEDEDETILPEDVSLYLPSHFMAVQHDKFKIASLGITEGKIREAAVYNAITSIRNAVKDVTVARQNNQVHGHSQAMHTCYRKIICNAERKQSSMIATYHTSCFAMISLGLIAEDDEFFKVIEDKDLFHKDTSLKRNIGDTYQNDGWIQGMPILRVASSDVQKPRVLNESVRDMFTILVMYMLMMYSGCQDKPEYSDEFNIKEQKKPERKKLVKGGKEKLK